MIPNVGITELVVVLAIVLLLFGARRIPQAARAIGSGVGEIREAGETGDRSGKAESR